MNSMRILLDSSIDYAGLFPPAGLSMTDAVGNYAASQRSSQSWALGRFVLPVSRLDELELAAREVLPRGTRAVPWRLSAVAGFENQADLGLIPAFNKRHSANAGDGAAVIDAVELKVRSAEEIRSITDVTAGSFATYLEVPLSDGTPALILSIAEAGVRAKVRTGGPTPDQFPAPMELARFILSCTQARVPFKATAGLHHPFRAVHHLNDNPASPSATMHGFLNVLLAACFARTGSGIDIVEAVLKDQAADSFRFGADGVSWRTHRLTNDHLLGARRESAQSFGSCSFHEPIGDLRSLNLL
ncbi:MAG TPA: hypothetical protein VE398_11710 [Acidobacteriota bacterium]|nr:hypothetical protein [Acidobacteriota bacterium]